MNAENMWKYRSGGNFLKKYSNISGRKGLMKVHLKTYPYVDGQVSITDCTNFF